MSPSKGSFRKGKRGPGRDWLLRAPLITLAIITYVPLAFTIITSFKTNEQFFTNIWLPELPLHPENYQRAWTIMGRAIKWSAVYSIPNLALVVVISGLAGYAFARYRFPRKELLFTAILALMMLPSALTLIPLFLQIVEWGWMNTVHGIVLPWTAGQIVLGMFLMRIFFETLPAETFEAARLDGASELTLFTRIALPLALPAFATLAILDLLFTWNDLIWPMVVTVDYERLPVAVAILTFDSDFYSPQYGVTYAGYIITIVPLMIVFSLTARRFMDGLEGGLGN